MKKSKVSQKAEGKVWRLEALSLLQLCVSGINRGPIRWGSGGCTRCQQTQIPRGCERKDSKTSIRWLSLLPSPTSTRAFRGFPLLLSRMHLHSLEGQQQRAMSKRPNSGPQLGGLTGVVPLGPWKEGPTPEELLAGTTMETQEDSRSKRLRVASCHPAF